MSKPIILVVGNENLGLDDGLSYGRDGFLFYVRENFSCETLIFDHAQKLEEAIEEVKFLHKTGRLVMALSVQNRRKKNEHKEIHRLIRSKISRELLIVKVGLYFGKGRSYWFEDKKLMDLIRKHLSNYEPRENYFGVETKAESNLLVSQLEKAYWKNYADTIPPTNDQVALEAMRLRLLAPELIKSEFDDALRNNVVFRKIKASVYQEECRIIGSMSEEEREEFFKRLCRELGGVGGSYGEHISALALDPETLVYSISSGWGNHNVAMIDTAGKMKMIIRLRRGEDLTYEEEKEIEKTKLLKGLIISIPRFKTPILRIMHDMEDIPKEVLLKIGQMFLDKREFIPVDWNANLLREEVKHVERSEFGSRRIIEAGGFKVVQVAIKGESLLYFGNPSITTHGIILEIALKENLNIQIEHPSREGTDYKVLGMGKVDFHPALKKMVLSGNSFGYKMDMRAADIVAIQATYPDWEIVLSY